MNKLKWAFKNPGQAVCTLYNHLLWLLPDELFLKIKFRQVTGKKLNLKNPQTFSEKIQWLKLYNRRPEYITMVDKYAVKDYVAGIIGKDYIIPTLGVWERAEDIEWDKLPDQFVLKCTHDSGGVLICRDKSKFDKQSAVEKLRNGLRHDYYRGNREWPYKNVPRRIIAEKFISPDPNLNDLPDYKFFCFNGEPKYCQVITGRGVKMCIDFFDKDWNHQPFHEPKNYPFSEKEPSKPKNLDRMWDAASKLAEEKPFSRIDFYEVGENVYFGEITFFPTTGMGGFSPENYDLIVGQMIQLPEIKNI